MYIHHDGAASSPFRVSVSTAAHRLRGQRVKEMVERLYTLLLIRKKFIYAL